MYKKSPTAPRCHKRKKGISGQSPTDDLVYGHVLYMQACYYLGSDWLQLHVYVLYVISLGSIQSI